MKNAAGCFVAGKGLVDLRNGTDAVHLRIRDLDRDEAAVVHVCPLLLALG
jgi:hypothetical protein